MKIDENDVASTPKITAVANPEGDVCGCESEGIRFGSKETVS